MQGLAKDTESIFRQVSTLPCLKEYTLIGGTALALQIHNRKSEDMDFCIWSKNLKKDKPTVDWPSIEKDLETAGKINSRDVLGFDQVNFIVNGVKISFIAKQTNLSPVRKPVVILNHISAADIMALGAMKIELILRRNEFRDYYDIYSILQEGISLKELVQKASNYSNHRLKTRDALSFLSNGNNYRKDRSFNLLDPYYDIDHKGIEEFLRSVIRREFKV
ncbi:MAG TPA: nucleotidyl transferase AbiEii/AbiGii toxin family protein [Bacteroidales bacterium]|nr:nucleotidyl transferase AbiEii/AbiGii toxin family protein [Bacteroidales bacterium]